MTTRQNKTWIGVAAMLIATGYGGQVIAQGALIIGGSNAVNG